MAHREPSIGSNGPPESATTVAHALARAINRQSVPELRALMTDGHVFVDSLGTCMAGKEKMNGAWEAYFRMVPDYTVTIEETYERGPVVLMLGSAQGTYAVDDALVPENRWSTPAAWRVVVQENLVAEWRVYSDNEPIRRIMQARIRLD